MFFALKTTKCVGLFISAWEVQFHRDLFCARRPSGHVSILLLINTASVPLFLHQRSSRLQPPPPLSVSAHRQTQVNTQIYKQGCQIRPMVFSQLAV